MLAQTQAVRPRMGCVLASVRAVMTEAVMTRMQPRSMSAHAGRWSRMWLVLSLARRFIVVAGSGPSGAPRTTPAALSGVSGVPL